MKGLIIFTVISSRHIYNILNCQGTRCLSIHVILVEVLYLSLEMMTDNLSFANSVDQEPYKRASRIRFDNVL